MSIWRQHKINNLLLKVQSVNFDFKYAFILHCDKLRLSTRDPYKMNLEELEQIWNEWEYTSRYWNDENLEIARKLEESYKLENRVCALYGGRQNLSKAFIDVHLTLSSYVNLDSYLIQLQELINNSPVAEKIDNYGVKFSYNQERLMRCPSDFQGEYAIPFGVVTIGEKAFFECKYITSVKIPNTVTTIEAGAFACCENLVSIDIPYSVIKVGDGAFNFSGIESVYIHNTIKSIADNMFWRCCKLSTVIIEDGVERIGDNAFRECHGLTQIYLPNSITYIGECAFDCCRNLELITLSKQIKELYPNVFAGCSALTSIVIPYGIEIIGFETFAYCDNLKEVDLPDSIKEVKSCAFSMCHNLKSIFVPKYQKRRFSMMAGLDDLTDLLIEKDR